MKNFAAKERKTEQPYEIWVAAALGGRWVWRVLKKWQVDDSKRFSRWLCHVITEMTGPGGDIGDAYVHDIKRHGILVYRDPEYAKQTGLPKVDRRREFGL